jgi:hypothetical protein
VVYRLTQLVSIDDELTRLAFSETGVPYYSNDPANLHGLGNFHEEDDLTNFYSDYFLLIQPETLHSQAGTLYS